MNLGQRLVQAVRSRVLQSSTAVSAGPRELVATAAQDPSDVPEPLCMPDILSLIFSHLTPTELCRGPVLVNKLWSAMAMQPVYWQESIDRSVVDMASRTQQSLGKLHYALYERNFLCNPRFLEHENNRSSSDPSHRLSRLFAQPTAPHWRVTETGGDRYVWECPPMGVTSEAPPPPMPCPGAQRASTHSQGKSSSAVISCIATSYQWTELQQEVNFYEELQRRGVPSTVAEELLDLRLPLRFSIYIGARQDCPCQFQVAVLLDDGSGEPNLQAVVARPSSHRFFSGRLEAEMGVWRRYSCIINPCPRGFRRATILLRGKDLQFWAGHYGVKFTSAELAFVPPDTDLQSYSDEVAGWEQRKIQAQVGHGGMPHLAQVLGVLEHEDEDGDPQPANLWQG